MVDVGDLEPTTPKKNMVLPTTPFAKVLAGY